MTAKGIKINETGLEVTDADKRYMLRTGIYGGIHVHDNSTSQNIPDGVTYTKVTAFTDNDPSFNVVSDAANDKLTLNTIGRYKLDGSFSFSTNTANINVFGTPFFNGIEQDNVHFVRKIATANDIGNAGFTGIIDVTSVPVDLDFRVRHSGSSVVAVTLQYANFNVVYAGDN